MATDFVLWIELEGFYAGHHASEPPLIVTRDKQVLDLCPQALRRGVRRGMTVRHAKSILMQCVEKPWSAQPYENSSHDWLDICCGYCGLIEPIDQHIAALDLGDHPDPLDITEAVIRSLVRETGLSVRYGYAASKWIACLAARHSDGGQALLDPAEFLSGLRVSDLLPVEPEIRERLRFLGYRTIGEVAAIPLPVLQEQFGEQALVISNSSRGIGFQPMVARASSPSSDPLDRSSPGSLPRKAGQGMVVPSYPKQSLHESFHPRGEIEDWQEVDRCFRLLAERLGRRLSKANLQSARIRLRIDFDPVTSEYTLRLPPPGAGGEAQTSPYPLHRYGGKFVANRRFTKPLHNPLTILIALRLVVAGASRPRIDDLEVGDSRARCPRHDMAFDRSIVRIWVTLSELEPVRQDQKRFHSLTGARPKAEKALSQVREVFGEKAVQLGSEIEVPRPVRVMREWRRATGWR